tara:strand:- start:778 stop:1050 length:273 start_codon:yes stop_codon:yes gene_type:complete
MKLKDLRLSQSNFTTEIGDITVVLNTDNGKYLELNNTASLIFKALEKQKDEEEIIEEICSIYSISRDELKDELKEFYRKALKAGILEKEI